MEDCILCGRCTTGCQEGAQFIGAIDILGTGKNTKIGTFNDEPLAESVCTTCGQCLSVCPTGAIKKKPEPKNVTKSVTTTCPYCGVGCGINIEVDKNNEMVNVTDDPNNKSSLGMLCVKGRFGYRFVQHKDRIKTPLIIIPRSLGRMSMAAPKKAACLDILAKVTPEPESEVDI